MSDTDHIAAAPAARARRDFLTLEAPDAAAAPPTPATGEDERERFDMRLQPRHAAYVRELARRRGETIERTLESIVREHRTLETMRMAAGGTLGGPAS